MHSCHCYFLLAGNSSIPILFHVERVRDGRSFATRTVQARQRGRCIFTTTISFVREDKSGAKQVQHAVPLPADAKPPPEDGSGEPEWSKSGPVMIANPEIVGGRDDTVQPHQRRCRQWTKARGQISPAGGHRAHLNALAYISDNWFIGTVSRIHGLWRWPQLAPEDVSKLPESDQRRIRALLEFDGLDSDPASIESWKGRDSVGMQVSLDHSIYFHEPARVKVDEWMFVDMESPWAGSGRGVVTQRIFARDGTLLATCMQEVSLNAAAILRQLVNVLGTMELMLDQQGVVRLKQQDDKKKASKL